MTDPVILAHGADENGLALMLHGLLSESIALKPSKRTDFDAMVSTIGIVAPDADVSVTLEFGGGACTVWDGLRKTPAVVLTADSGKIPELSQLQIKAGLPWLFDNAGKAFVQSLLRREIRLSGLITLPPNPLRSARALLDLLRLTRILSVA